MNQAQIKQFLAQWEPKKDRTIVIIDYANVDKWKENLSWTIGIRELAGFVKNFSSVKDLRRFYYGSDFGSKTTSKKLTPWSKTILEGAQFNNLTVITKRVKYIHDNGEQTKKCNLDVEMTIDLVSMQDQYDHIVLFSGDGDMAYALEYVCSEYKKSACVFGARDSVGSELIDAQNTGVVDKLMWAEDFQYRLDMRRHTFKNQRPAPRSGHSNKIRQAPNR